ncbi:MAG: HAD family hydrolase [Oscillospiraceae bacterium]|nr:HAD family hydrolase [Oscillospiraceae bacterium]
MIKLAAFDLDGTIGETIPMCIEAFRKAVSPYVGHCLTYKEIIETFGMNEVGMVKAIISDNWQGALSDFYQIYEEMHRECRAPYNGIKELLQELRNKGTKIALITGKGDRSCQITLEQFGLTNYFDDVLTGSETGNVKADSITFLMKKYNLTGDECVYIGDALSDVEEAQQAGIICLSALWGITADKKNISKNNPDFLFYTVDEVAKYLLN